VIRREVIDEILLRNDIESLIGSYVSLKRAGSNLVGLCPFHNEKTPSFTVFPATKGFYCFGCGVGGDVITFVMKAENLDYIGAITHLAKRCGMEMPENDFQKNDPNAVKKSRIYAMNRDAARFFHDMLSRPEGAAGLAYLRSRGLTDAVIRRFGLGFAPDGFLFVDHMHRLGYTDRELEAGFLVKFSQNKRPYPLFRNRVMFPVIDTTGEVVAFGGRVMDDSEPKYLNSSDTPVFKKSRNLFALNLARHSCAERIVLCEGYMDVIAVHTAGVPCAVATLGTAITSEQARLMSRYTKKVIISYDADEAGQKAAQRAMKMLDEVGLAVGVIKVPGAKDPDEYIKTYGKDKFRDIISGSKTKFEYNMDSILSKFDLNIPQDKIDALIELEKMISRVNSKAERDIYIQSVSEKIGVDPKSVRDDVERLVKKSIYAQRKSENDKLKQQAAGFGDRVNPDYAKAPAVAGHEENVLGLLLLYPEHRKKVFAEKLLTVDDFFTDLNRRVFEYTRLLYESPDNENLDVNFHFSPDEVGRIAKMKISRMNLTNNGEDVLLDCITLLKDSMKKKNVTTATTFDALNDLINSMKNKT